MCSESRSADDGGACPNRTYGVLNSLNVQRLVAEGRVDAVLLTDARLDDPRYALVRELGVEAVVVGHPDPASGLPGVAADERTALARAVRELVDLGHERIAHVTGPSGLVHVAERRGAWRAALLAAGLPPDIMAIAGLRVAREHGLR